MEQTALRPKPLPGDEPDPGRSSATSATPPTATASAGSGKPGRSAAPRKGHRPHAARRRGRRLFSLLFGLFCAVVLLLSGIGLGTVGATVIGMSKLAEMQSQAGEQGAAMGAAPATASGTGPDQAADPKAPPKAPSEVPPKAPPKASPDVSPKKTSSGKGAAAVGADAPRPALGVEAVDAPGGGGALVVGVHQPGPGHAAGLVRGDVLLAFGGSRVTSAGDLAKAVAGARPGRNVTLTVRHASGARQVLSARPGLLT
ncbi:PDZ domain-containing protein [Streptomyces sp. NPDC127108]|uniref:PDZ domain-containing protein n=1 Tax=Streptomyces sp. NPDC127108 TaxID=3345361 RepID=UPI00363B4E86